MNLFSLPAICWIIISTVLLTLPGSAFPEKNWFGTLMLDKWIHIAMFGLMVLLLCWSVFKTNLSASKKKTYFIVAAILCLCYGVAMEFIQENYIPHRSFDAGDIVADGVGSALGLLVSSRRFLKK